MIVIFGFLIIIALIYFPSRRSIKREQELGKRHLENLDKIDSQAREIIEGWVKELKTELKASFLTEDKLNRIIGIKIAQSRNTDELGLNFKELPKSLDNLN